MTFSTFTFLPEGVSFGVALALIVLSFFASALTAAFGLGGGMAMLAGLGLVMPPAILVPVHGCIQLGSNAGRAVVQRAHIQWHTAVWFALGAIPGAVAGGGIAVALPEALFQILIGIFILYCLWGPQPDISGRGPLANVAAGVLISALGMVTGVSGPLVANFLRKIADRRALIATHATIMAFSNVAKVVVFSALGFAFAAYLPLIALMIASGFAGTLLGSRLLEHMPERTFRRGFRIVLSLMALEMLRGAVF
ncbi:sulfite exporter TauE/SafE family protein [Pelagibacterium xiamenense]|uniref:sulfite exporter TauE/SafE family protein n=1 Tax=Pelagibacterium xiamenense TaxID=2901140 RepID=UPI001E51190D|nr:sulfite exporter TauE/SafE family protein [Pelagibacterium xiamenense]MCD7059515.1 sulfite exporter TauE/SafE family protein [Pelagibacterium xiamenense]